MKKQTKRSTKAQKQYRFVHTPAQRFRGIMAFFALFICGVMVVLGLSDNKANTQPTNEQNTEPTAPIPLEQKTCTLIEESLLVRLPNGDEFATVDNRIVRAQIYANLSERGCTENSQKFYELAKQELEIARALSDDEFSQNETFEVIETYKRLNMQAAAEEIFETAKKLTNPAIDFILAVEKIINEQ